MFARSVFLYLKAGGTAQFTRTVEEEVIPLLRKQKGFMGAMVLTVPGGAAVVGISFRDRKENLEIYSHDTQVQKILSNVCSRRSLGHDTWCPLRAATPLSSLSGKGRSIDYREI